MPRMYEGHECVDTPRGVGGEARGIKNRCMTKDGLQKYCSLGVMAIRHNQDRIKESGEFERRKKKPFDTRRAQKFGWTVHVSAWSGAHGHDGATCAVWGSAPPYFNSKRRHL